MYLVVCSTRCPSRCTLGWHARADAASRSPDRSCVTEIEGVWLTAKASIAQLVHPRDHVDRESHSGRSGRRRGRRRSPAAGRWGAFVRSANRSTSTSSPGAECPYPRSVSAGRDAGITHGAPAFVPRRCSSSGPCCADAESERPGERLGAGEVRLLELQPREVDHLDHGVARSTGVLSGRVLRPRRVGLCADLYGRRAGVCRCGPLRPP